MSNARADLYFLSDASNGFWNIHRVAGSGAAAVGGAPLPFTSEAWQGAAVSALPRPGVDFGGDAPGWRFGGQGFSFLADGTLLAACKDADAGGSKLIVVSPGGAVRAELSRAHGLPYAFNGVEPGARMPL